MNQAKHRERLTVVVAPSVYVPCRLDEQTATMLEGLAAAHGGNKSAAIRACVREVAAQRANQDNQRSS